MQADGSQPHRDIGPQARHDTECHGTAVSCQPSGKGTGGVVRTRYRRHVRKQVSGADLNPNARDLREFPEFFASGGR